MTLTSIVIVILVLLLVGTIPSWPYSREWGFRPSVIVGAFLLLVLVLVLIGRL